MIARERYYRQIVDTDAVVGTTKTLPNFSFLPKVASGYWLFVEGEIASNAATDTATISLSVGGAGVVDTNMPYFTATNEFLSFSSQWYIDPADHGGVETLINITVAAGALTTLTVRNVFIHIFEQVSTDYGKLFSGGSSKAGSESTYQTWDSLAITPTGNGDYIIFARASVVGGQITDSMMIEITDGTTVRGECAFRMAHVSEQRPWVTVFRVTGLVATTTYTVKVKSLAGTAAYNFAGGAIFAMDCDTFDNVQTSDASMLARTALNVTTYNDAGASLTFMPIEQEHLVIACHVIDGSTTAILTSSQILEGATQLAEMANRNTLASGASDYCFFKMYVRPLPAGSQTWKAQIKRSAALGGPTVGIEHSFIGVVQFAPTNPKLALLGKTALLGKVALSNG